MSQKKYLTVRINDKCQPLDRRKLYEVPLDKALRKEGLGEVTRGDF